VLITWALIMEGGVQVNAEGQRFSNEHEGYSEQAVKVLSQPGGVAWTIYDDRLDALGMTFPDYRDAIAAGARMSGAHAEQLAERIGVPAETLAETLRHVATCQSGVGTDPFGRDFTAKPALSGPLHAIRVTGSLFHTQGGLVIDATARVLRPDGSPLPNIYAGGGAACGVSGADVSGYLSGNGLLTAIALGDIAGRTAAAALGGGDLP
jgi:fumarate reductase flavoprotein subunit